LRLGEPTKARASFQEALTHRKELVAANSSDGMLKLDLGRSHMALGEIDFRERKWPAAREQFQNALLLAEEIARRYATSPTAKRELANTLGNFGVFELRTGGLADSEKHLARCLTLMKQLADADPANALNQRYLGLAHYRLATLARKRNDAESAERSNRECLKIREKLAPASESRQIDLLLVLPRCGQHGRAAELAAKIQSGGKADREVLVDLAQCLAQCAAAADQKELQQRYVNQAMAVLQEATAKGFNDVTLLETEPDFDALRQDSEFQALIRRLNKG
jgi:tetratricopeptide (TPR) repeat protein